MKKILFNSALLICMAIIFNACQKDKDKTPDQTIVNETSTTQSDFDDIQKEMEDVMSKKDNGTLRVAANPCYNLVWDSSAAHLITLTFSGIYCNGRTRSGQVLIHYTDYFKNAGAVITITLNNYYINGHRIQGKKVITNNGNSSGKYSFSVVVSDSSIAGTGFAKLTFPDGSYTNWKSSRTHTWDQGQSTPLTLLDDEWVINGTFSGLSREGVSFTGSLSSLRYKIACWYSYIFYPESGSLSVTTVEGTRSLDFGTGDCDKKAKFTALNGKTYDIDLK